MTEEPIQYKEFYNKDRDLPEPLWGNRLFQKQCPTCDSDDIYASASSDDPTEIFPAETVRCGNCGHITDWYESYKQRLSHPGKKPRYVVRDTS